MIGVTPNATTQWLPTFLQQWLIFEVGIADTAGKVKVWTDEIPEDYVPLKDKLTYLRQMREGQEPEGWVDGFPGARRRSLLQRYPASTPVWGKTNSVCPAGSSYYPIVRVELKKDSELYVKYRVTEVIACVEQIVGDRWDGDVESWPAGTFSITSRYDEKDGPVDETGAQTDAEREFQAKVRERNGVWRSVEAELDESLLYGGGYEAEDYGSDAYDEELEESEESSQVVVTESEVPESEADYGEAESARD